MKVMSKKREQPSEGTHLARVLNFINLGHQPGFTWSGGEVDSAYKFDITYELVDEQMEDGRPFVISEEVTNSDSEKGTLRVRCQATKTDLHAPEGMLGRPCMVTVANNAKGYAKVAGQAGVSGCPDGVPVPDLTNEPVLFDPWGDEVDLDAWSKIYEWKQNKIKEALDYEESTLYKELLKSE